MKKTIVAITLMTLMPSTAMATTVVKLTGTRIMSDIQGTKGTFTATLTFDENSKADYQTPFDYRSYKYQEYSGALSSIYFSSGSASFNIDVKNETVFTNIIEIKDSLQSSGQDFFTARLSSKGKLAQIDLKSNYNTLSSVALIDPSNLTWDGSKGITIQVGSTFFSGNITSIAVGDAPASTPAVPEPATWAMMLLGFGMVGAAARYRRRSATLAAA